MGAAPALRYNRPRIAGANTTHADAGMTPQDFIAKWRSGFRVQSSEFTVLNSEFAGARAILALLRRQNRTDQNESMGSGMSEILARKRYKPGIGPRGLFGLITVALAIF